MSLIRIRLWSRFRAALAVTGVALLLTAPVARARDNLANAIPSLYGGDGITLAPPTSGFSHAAHFTDEALVELNELHRASPRTWAGGLSSRSPATPSTWSSGFRCAATRASGRS
jgi:hypothetical protein